MVRHCTLLLFTATVLGWLPTSWCLGSARVQRFLCTGRRPTSSLANFSTSTDPKHCRIHTSARDCFLAERSKGHPPPSLEPRQKEHRFPSLRLLSLITRNSHSKSTAKDSVWDSTRLTSKCGAFQRTTFHQERLPTHRLVFSQFEACQLTQ